MPIAVFFLNCNILVFNNKWVCKFGWLTNVLAAHKIYRTFEMKISTFQIKPSIEVKHYFYDKS